MNWKFRLDKYKIAILLGIAVVALVAFLDIKSATSGVFGSLADYTNGFYTNGWWDLFKGIVLVSFAFIPVCYFFLVKRDLSNSIAIYATSWIMWAFGLADVLYFWLRGVPVVALLPWLDSNPTIGLVANLLGSSVVTNWTLYVSVIVGLVIVFVMTTLLEKINFKIGGVRI